MHKYKLIMSDLDGTLLKGDQNISDETKKMLMTLQKQGVTLMLCSGRPQSGIIRFSEELELNKYKGIIGSYNGGRVLDVYNNKVIYENPVPIELAKKILKHLEQFDVTPVIYDNEYIYTPNSSDSIVMYEAKTVSVKIKQVDNLADFVNFDPVKILVTAPEEVFKSIGGLKILESFYDEVECSFSAPYFLEINKKGTNKGNALKETCKFLNILPSEVIAFGDNGNDIEMLKAAGLGVAMSNASDEIKKFADEVTPTSNEEDGIAHVLKKYFQI